MISPGYQAWPGNNRWGGEGLIERKDSEKVQVILQITYPP